MGLPGRFTARPVHSAECSPRLDRAVNRPKRIGQHQGMAACCGERDLISPHGHAPDRTLFCHRSDFVQAFGLFGAAD